MTITRTTTYSFNYASDFGIVEIVVDPSSTQIAMRITQRGGNNEGRLVLARMSAVEMQKLSQLLQEAVDTLMEAKKQTLRAPPPGDDDGGEDPASGDSGERRCDPEL